MGVTIGECQCDGGDYTTITAVKEYVRYHLGEFPFTTKRKINHHKCKLCDGITDLDDNKELMADMTINRAFMAEQDRTYKVTDNTPIVPIKGYVEPGDERWYPTVFSKRWHTGFIHYLRQVVTVDKVSIVPASAHYTVYCNEEDKLSVAIKQFIKPDDYFKLTSIQ